MIGEGVCYTSKRKAPVIVELDPAQDFPSIEHGIVAHTFLTPVCCQLSSFLTVYALTFAT